MDGTITDVVLAAIEGRGEHPALVGPGRTLTFGGLSALVPAAAGGLALRGVAPGDAAVVDVDGVADFALALHALSACGAVPVVPGPGVDLAALLAATCARVLVVGGGAGASAAIAAADEAFVRQVFAFGPVNGAATDFGVLLAEAGPVKVPLADPALRTWVPEARLTHADLIGRALRLADLLRAGPGRAVVTERGRIAPAVWTALVDAALLGGTCLVEAAGPEEVPATAAAHGARVAVLDPAALRRATDHAAGRAAVPEPPLRVLVTGPVPADVAAGCADLGWTLTCL